MNESEFPILMQSVNDGLVVLFESENCGTVVSDKPNSGDLRLGYTSNAFISWDRKDIWKKYEGEITLKNK
jgi:hypothetical protein